MLETYVIHITKKCNLDCLYCYETDKESEYTKQEIQENIDNLFKDIGDNIVHIEFLGGEPMLRFDLVLFSYNYLESKYKKNIINYTITTNGTVLNDDIITFLKNNRVSFAISMDGTKFSNQLRYFKNTYVNSYDKVVENIKKLKESNITPSIHIVTHPYNVHLLFRNIKHIYLDIGVHSIGIGTIESTMVIDENYCNTFKKQIMLVSDYITKNEITDLGIDLFHEIKPLSDARTYVRDHSGKVVFESYGRIDNSVFNNKNLYEIVKCSEQTDVSMMIYSIRKFAFDYHKENKMSLLKQEENDKNNIIDCVGKIGNCDFVTNPKNNKLYKNKNIISEKTFDELASYEPVLESNSSNEIILKKEFNKECSYEDGNSGDEKTLKKECLCKEGCSCEDDNSLSEKIDVLATGISQILISLEEIKKVLK